ITSQRIKDGLKQAIVFRDALGKTTREIREQERQLQVITQDQGRLRANIREVPTGSAAYKRYVAKFDQQETQIEKYQADIKKLQTTEHRQRKEFEDFLTNFSAD